MKKLITLSVLLLLILCSNSYSQEIDASQSFQDYADSIETQIILKSNNATRELKHFRRWQELMETRVGSDNSLKQYFKARAEFENAASGVRKSASVSNVTWNFFGPTGIPSTPHNDIYRRTTGKGWVYKICVDPSDSISILAGTHHGGLWKTSNNGNSWIPLTDDEEIILGINSMVTVGNTIIVSSAYEQEQYGSYFNGLFRSTDGGSNWTSINNGPLSSIYESTDYKDWPRKLYINPFDSDELFFVTYSSVYKSTDLGNNWSLLLSTTDTWAAQSFGFYDIEIVQNYLGMETIYVSGSTIHKSVNGGTSWTDITELVTEEALSTPEDRVDRVEMGTNPLYYDKVWFYFREYGVTSNPYTHLVKYDGSSYDHLGSQSKVHDGKDKLECEISPNDEDIVYVGGLEIQKFDETGSSFTPVSSLSLSLNSLILEGSNWVHADLRDLVIVDNNGIDRIYAAHDGGVSWGEWDTALSPDGYNFHHISDDGTNGLYNTEFYGFDVADRYQEFLVGGCQDLSVFVFGAPGYLGSWIHSASGDGSNSAIDPNNNLNVYELDFCNNNLRRSTDGGISFGYLSLNPDRRSELVFDPIDSDVLYVGATGGVNKYSPASTSSSPTSLTPPGIGSNVITAVAIDPDDNDIIYTASNGYGRTTGHLNAENYIWRTEDGTGSGFTSISENLTSTSSTNPCRNGFVTSIVINPNNTDELWVSFARATNGSEKVFHSTDGGSTWEVLSTNYPVNVPAERLLYDEVANLLYVATDVGIYYYDENSGWTLLGTGLPRKMVTDIELNDSTGVLYVSTFGRGIWKAELPEENCYGSHSDINITTNTLWSVDDVLCANVLVSNSSILTISADIYQNPKFNFTIESGSELIVNGGVLETGVLTVNTGAELSTANGGEITINSFD